MKFKSSKGVKHTNLRNQYFFMISFAKMFKGAVAKLQSVCSLSILEREIE
jgi:hypothetical protein